MSLAIASSLITLALIFYSIGIWSERLRRLLLPWHVVAFWLGFLFDGLGTWAMHEIAQGPFDILKPHTLTGQLALWLMCAHAVWATIVVRSDDARMKSKFHRYSVAVWMIWLVPYFGGMFIAMSRMH